MKYFTIDSENNITAHANRQAARATGDGVFASEIQFADLIGDDNKRLIEIWNSLPGVTPVKKFTNRQIATERIFRAIQSLGEFAITAEPVTTPQTPAAEPIAQPPQTEPAPEDVATPAISEPAIPAAEQQASPEPAAADFAPESSVAPVEAAQQTTPFDEPVASVSAETLNVALPKAKATKKAAGAKKASKGEPKAKVANERANKKAEVIAMMTRATGATLPEIMTATGWQAHTVRGFVSILGSKEGQKIESSKDAAGERTYRIAK